MRETHHEPVAVPMVATEQAGYPWPDEVVEFVRHAYRRRPVEWPELYDELCYLAARATYHGLGFEELGQLGLRFHLDELPKVARLAERVADEEQAARRASRASFLDGEWPVEALEVAVDGPLEGETDAPVDRRRPMTLPVARSRHEPVPMARVTIRGALEPRVAPGRGAAD